MAKIDSISKTFDPNEAEPRLYNQWNEKGYFKPDPDTSKEAFSIVMPPPNITGQLHMGHALDNTLQDTLIRFKRMQGFCALWLPAQTTLQSQQRRKSLKLCARKVFPKRISAEKNFSSAHGTGKRNTAAE